VQRNGDESGLGGVWRYRAEGVDGVDVLWELHGEDALLRLSARSRSKSRSKVKDAKV